MKGREPDVRYHKVSRPVCTRLFPRVVLSIALSLLLLGWHFHAFDRALLEPWPISHKSRFQKCSLDNYLDTGLPFLDGIERPPLEEYITRRNKLAKALVDDGVDAFVVEPGYTFTYYANVTQPQWEVWEPEERPFLMIVRPILHSNGSLTANTTFLVPKFEEERARLLNMPFPEDEHIVMTTYQDHEDPYTALWLSPIWGDILSPILMVDEEMRDFIARGLASNGFTTVGLGGEVEAVRQVKTPLEIDILRAVNTCTVEAIRAMRPCLYPGVTENEVREVLDETLRAGGPEPFFDVVEFGVSAALPHGGLNGTKKLEVGDFVLIDVGAHLYGYSSDVTRTFYPPFFPRQPPPDSEQVHVWNVVRAAQAAAVEAMMPDGTAANVDIAARNVIEMAGYGKYFTHRLGHSLGIKAHESPYLHMGNAWTKLRAGMVFTAEPGVYITNEFGIRHEDVLVVREDGEAENISGGFAKDPWTP